jgi:D-alanine-D-alanine ligase
MPPRILVLYNEPILPADHPDAGSEHDILDTVADAFKILEAAGFETTRLGINYDPQPLLDALKQNPPDAVFNLFEGLPTHPDTEVSVASLLEWLQVPFTGCPVTAMVLGRDKIRTKHLLAAVGLPTAEYAVVGRWPAPIWPHAWPAIVKPAYQDASVGIDQKSVVTNQMELEERVRFVLDKYGPPVLVERYIAGREFHVHMIEDAGCPGPLVLPLAEIAFDQSVPGRWDVYTFTAKWDENSDEYRTAPLKAPVEIPPADFERLQAIAVRAYAALMCRDYARIDVRMDADGRFYILEMNPNPYLNSLALVNGLMAIDRTHEQQIVAMALAAIARGSKAVATDTIRVPVGVVTGI